MGGRTSGQEVYWEVVLSTVGILGGTLKERVEGKRKSVKKENQLKRMYCMSKSFEIPSAIDLKRDE